jgi:hypothetical protein
MSHSNVIGTQVGGVKHDSSKPEMSLISSLALTYLSAVLTFGAKKYAPNNWRKGLPLSKLLSASMRHIVAINGGEDYDSESGLPHAAHLMCEAMFMCEQLTASPIGGIVGDDRYHYNENQKDLLAALLAGDVKAVSEQLNAIHSNQSIHNKPL